MDVHGSRVIELGDCDVSDADTLADAGAEGTGAEGSGASDRSDPERAGVHRHGEVRPLARDDRALRALQPLPARRARRGLAGRCLTNESRNSVRWIRTISAAPIPSIAYTPLLLRDAASLRASR